LTYLLDEDKSSYVKVFDEAMTKDPADAFLPFIDLLFVLLYPLPPLCFLLWHQVFRRLLFLSVWTSSGWWTAGVQQSFHLSQASHALDLKIHLSRHPLISLTIQTNTNGLDF